MEVAKHLSRVSRAISLICRNVNCKRWSRSHTRAMRTFCVTSAAVAGVKHAQSDVKLQMPDPATLSTEYLLKSSTIATVEHANSLLSYTAIAMERAEKKYAEAVFTLSLLMEYRLNVLGHSEEENRISDLILEARTIVNKTKEAKKELEIMLMTAKTLVNSAAEMAYMTGAETSSSIGGDRLNKVDQLLRTAHAESEEAERKLRETEAKTIATEAVHAEESEKQKRKQEEAFDVDKNQNDDGVQEKHK